MQLKGSLVVPCCQNPKSTLFKLGYRHPWEYMGACQESMRPQAKYNTLGKS